MNTTPPDICPSWAKLEVHAESWRTARITELFENNGSREAQFSAYAPGIRYDYSRQRMGSMTLQLLLQLAQERGLPEWRDAFLRGDEINATESRAAKHWALRAGESAPAEVKAALASMSDLAAQIRAGALTGATGKPFARIVHLGTGGSDLGPRLLVDALAEQCDPRIAISFAANVDPIDLDRILRMADPETTLFVVVSKTFTTQETLENAGAAKRWLSAALPAGADVGSHFVAVTANEAAATTFGVAALLPMWDWVGGRYSVWSPVGFTVMCACGDEAFRDLLAGAAELDQHFAETPPEDNVPVLMALIGVWNVNFLRAATHAVLPYSTALRLLPSYLQQLEMESNGKNVDREGRMIEYATSPVVWGAEGTVGQHSFHQLLHQGTQEIPVDFVLVSDAPGEPARRAILSAHAMAQASALANGRDDPAMPPHRRYPGNRPSSTLSLERLDARNMGRLLALYEHKVFVQGVIWNINSFDQWGVELGKALAAEILGRQLRT